MVHNMISAKLTAKLVLVKTARAPTYRHSLSCLQIGMKHKHDHFLKKFTSIYWAFTLSFL